MSSLAGLVRRALGGPQDCQPLLRALALPEQIDSPLFGRAQLVLDRAQLGLHRVQLTRELFVALHELGLLVTNQLEARACGFAGDRVRRNLRLDAHRDGLARGTLCLATTGRGFDCQHLATHRVDTVGRRRDPFLDRTQLVRQRFAVAPSHAQLLMRGLGPSGGPNAFLRALRQSADGALVR